MTEPGKIAWRDRWRAVAVIIITHVFGTRSTVDHSEPCGKPRCRTCRRSRERAIPQASIRAPLYQRALAWMRAEKVGRFLDAWVAAEDRLIERCLAWFKDIRAPRSEFVVVGALIGLASVMIWLWDEFLTKY